MKAGRQGILSGTAQALTLNMTPAEAVKFSGEAHLSKGERELALADYGQAIALDPRLASARR